MSEQVTNDAAVLRDLRRVRRQRRLGDTEWFDVLYRVYLFALVGSVVVVTASDSIQGLIDEPVATDRILSRGPSIAGVVAVLALVIGIRNGADGGPVSIESADVRHVLLSPISRTRVLLRPVTQRFRAVAFATALALGTLGQLVAREVEGSRAAWAASAALFGVLLAALYVGGAVLAHAGRVPRWVATAIAVVALAWQARVAWLIWDGSPTGWQRIGPGNLVGSVLFWGIRQRGIDAVAIVAVAALVGAALALSGRLRLEPLERRGQLVSQLRFAATVQDIRTVVLLRRQLRAESTRARPWLGRPRARTTPVRPSATRPRRSGQALTRRVPVFVWRRGVYAIGRLPISRFVRIASLAAVAGVAATLAVEDSLLFLVVLVAAVFLLGLESLEPLAAEIDRPDLTDGFPVPRGWLYAHHLVAPAGLLAVAGIVGAAAASIVQPDYAASAFALGIPLAWVGSIGAIVTTVRDAPEPASIANTSLFGADRTTESPFALPEFAGFGSVATAAIPIVLSALAAVPVAALRAQPGGATIIRSLVGALLCLATTTIWVIRRDELSVGIRNFFAAGRPSPGGATS